MAETGGTYLPPVIASLIGEVGGLAKSLVEAKALLEDFSKTPTTAELAVELSSLAQLEFDFMKDVAALRIAAQASPVEVPVTISTASAIASFFRVKAIWAALGSISGGGNAGGLGTAAGFGAGTAIPFTGLALARFGSLAGLAGFGLERVLTLALGLIASLTEAFLGLGVIAAGTFATMAVGMGSDMVVMSSTIADTKTLFTAWQAVQQAVLLYGANSQQAQAATTNLNNQLKILGNTAGVQAELGVAKLAYTVGQQFDQATSQARVQAAGLLTQILYLGQTYIPLVAAAAQRNLSIINTALVPLFTWLKGPQGMGIFNDLENKFAKDLPTAMDAFDQGMEFLLRFLDLASNYTGGFIQSLDRLFTYLNSPQGWARVKKDVGDVVKVFEIWKGFFVILFKDLALLFGQAVGVGTTMASMLTGILTKLHDYLSSTSGKNAVGSLFNAHKNEIVAILNLLPQLAPMLSIYLALAVPLTTIATDVIKLLNFMLSIPTVGPAIAWGLALIIIVRQLQLIALLTGLAALIRGIGLSILLAGAIASGNAPAFGRLSAALFGVDAATAAAALPLIMIGLLLIATGVLVYLLVSHWKELSSTVGGIMSLLGTLFHNAIGQWGGVFSELGMIVQAIGKKFTTAFTTWGDVFSLLGTAIHTIAGKITTTFTTAFATWGAIFSLLGTAVNLIGVKISTAFNNMIATVKATIGQWYSIGDGIVTGVINGINNKLTWARNQIGNFFNSLLGAAKRAIGYGSPARVYTELAATIPQGVAQGINQNSSAALTALSSMFNQMQNHSRMLAGAGGYGTMAFSGAGGGGRGPVSVNMPITVQVSGAQASTPLGIGGAVQKAVHQEVDRMIQLLQGGIYSNPGA